MTFSLAIIFFGLGLIIGSFLNVVIFRFNTQRSFGGRSGCMVCQKKLSWYELFPVFSFIFLRGRCKGCKTKISIQYPIIELLSGFIFLSIFLKFQYLFYFDTLNFTLSYAYYVAVFCMLLVIAVYDYKHKIIPDIFSIFLGIITFIGLFLFKDFTFSPHIPSLLQFLSGIFLALPFAFIWLISKGTWMGLGDAKLSLGMGWLLGYGMLLSAAVLAFWSGAIIGIFLLLFSYLPVGTAKKYGIKSEIPFAPFLVLGVFLSFIFELRFF